MKRQKTIDRDWPTGFDGFLHPNPPEAAAKAVEVEGIKSKKYQGELMGAGPGKDNQRKEEGAFLSFW